MNQCTLEIFFKFVPIRDKFMSVKIHHRDTTFLISPIDCTTQCWQNCIELPTIINLEFFGKNQNQDTVIDQTGQMIEDKHVVIKEIRLDNLSVEPLYLEKKLALVHQSGVSYSNYIGFNGQMNIEFTKISVFHQLAEMKRLGEY